MKTAPTATSPSSATPRKRTWIVGVLILLVLIGGFIPFSTMPSRSPITAHPATWTPGGLRLDMGWHEVEVDTLDGTVCQLFAILPDAGGRVLIASQSPGIGVQLGLYDAAGTLLAESEPLPPLTEQWLRDGVLLQIPPRTLGWPVVFLVDPLTLRVTRELALSGDPALLDKLPAEMHFLDAILTDNGEFRALVMVPPLGQVTQARWFWLAADATGHVTSLKQTPDGYAVAHAWPRHHPSVLLFGRNSQDATMHLAVDYLSGESMSIIEEAPPELIPRARDDATYLRHAPLAPRRLPLRLTDGARFVPYFAAELSLPRLYVPDEFAQNIANPISQSQFPFTLERLRYETWKRRYPQEQIRRTAANSISVDAMTLIVDADSKSLRAIHGDLLTTTAIELAHSLAQTDYATKEVLHPVWDPLIHDQPAEFGLDNEYLRGIQAWPLPDERVLVLQCIRAPSSVPEAPKGLLRIGVLPSDTDTITWLGYLALPNYFDIAPEHQPLFFQLRRSKDQLICSFGGRHLATDAERAAHFDLYWTAFPVPPELIDLPEGIMQ